MASGSSFFRDPVWQAVGVLVTILLFIGMLPFRSTKTREIVVVRIAGTTSDELFSNDLFTLMDRKTKQERPAVEINHILVMSVGTKAIRPNDIVDPIKLLTPEARLIAVTACPGWMQEIEKSNVEMRWKNQGNVWEANRTLLNPGDIACATLFSERTGKGLKDELKVEVTARIADSTFKYFDSRYDYAIESKMQTPSQWLLVYIYFGGWQVYLFLFLQVALFLSTYVVARAAEVFDGKLYKTCLWLGLILLVSTASAEVLTSFLNFNIHEIHPIFWPILFFHVVVIPYFFFHARHSGATP